MTILGLAAGCWVLAVIAGFDGANITAADIEASNGVIHVIDAVVLPK